MPSNHNLPPIPNNLTEQLLSREDLPSVGKYLSVAWSSWRGGMLKWCNLGGVWYLKDRDAARVLAEPVRVINQRAARRPAWFPRDFGYRLGRNEANWAFRGVDRRARRGGREPWVYSFLGILQQRRLAGVGEIELMRFLAALLTGFPGPVPPGLRIPQPPQSVEALTPWVRFWVREDGSTPS